MKQNTSDCNIVGRSQVCRYKQKWAWIPNKAKLIFFSFFGLRRFQIRDHFRCLPIWTVLECARHSIQTFIEETKALLSQKMMSLSIRKKTLESTFPENSAYRISDAKKKNNNFSNDICFTILKPPIKTLLWEVQSVVTAKGSLKKAMNPWKIALFRISGFSSLWWKKQKLILFSWKLPNLFELFDWELEGWKIGMLL